MANTINTKMLTSLIVFIDLTSPLNMFLIRKKDS